MIKVKIVNEHDEYDAEGRHIYCLEYEIMKFIEDNNLKADQIISIGGGGMPYSTNWRGRGSGDSVNAWAIITYEDGES